MSLRHTWCSRLSQRSSFVFFSSIGLCIGSAIRAILPIAITQMVTDNGQGQNSLNSTKQNEFENTTLMDYKLFDWDERIQGLVLSSFYWGYVPSQFFCGSLAENFGGKYIFGQSVLVPAALTFITPLAVGWGDYTVMIILRVIMGLSSSAMFPAVSTMISEWTTPAARAKSAGVIFSGYIPGIVVGTTGPALIIRYAGIGWPGAFYVFGVLGLVWFCLWTLMCFSDVESHPFISDSEKKYLQESLKVQKYSKLPPAPYKHILRSIEFWSFVVGLIGHSWLFYLVSTDLPKYMNAVVGVSIEDNGYLSSLPYFFMWLNSMFSSWMNHFILSRNLMSLTNLRKLVGSISISGPALCIMAASYADKDKTMVVCMFVFGILLMGSAYSSILLNGLDLSPSYSGTLMAVANGISALCGVIAPYTVGVFAPNQAVYEWRIVFWLGFAVAAITNVFYVLYASGEVQRWNDPKYGKNVNHLQLDPLPVDTSC